MKAQNLCVFVVSAFAKTAKTSKLPLDMLIIMQTESVCSSTTSACWKELSPSARHGAGDEQRKFTGMRCVAGNEGTAAHEREKNVCVLQCGEISGCLKVRLQYAHQLALCLCCFPQSAAADDVPSFGLSS